MAKAKDLYDSMVDGVYSLSIDQLIDLQDLIDDAIANLQREKMIDLQEKAIKAIKDYTNAGGGLDYEGNIIFRIDEDHAGDNDYNYIHLK